MKIERPTTRGDVHLVSIELPNRDGTPGFSPRLKFVIVLRGSARTRLESDFPFVVASSDRRQPGQQLRGFEIFLDSSNGFDHDTIVDCRWVYTAPKTLISDKTYRFSLGPVEMQDISVALVNGLQL